MEHRREYDRARYHKRRREFIELLGGKCAECGSSEDLEFDHIDPTTKLYNVSVLWTKPKAVLLEELAKCQLLCGRHHSQKSSVESSVDHGGGVSGKRNCSCALCKARKAEYMKEYGHPNR